jgi:hypothetical protein
MRVVAKLCGKHNLSLASRPSATATGSVFPHQCRHIQTELRKIKSLPAILRRVAYPVNPLGFQFVQNYLLLSQPDCIGDRLGHLAGLSAELNHGLVNKLE